MFWVLVNVAETVWVSCCLFLRAFCLLYSVILQWQRYLATLAGVNYFEAPYLILNLTSKDPCKRTQHCWQRTPNIVVCYVLRRPFAHPGGCCWELLHKV